MKNFIFRLSLIILLAIIISACSTGIGLKTDFEETNFILDKTTKNEVISRLGLPQKILKDTVSRDHYFYEGSTHLIGLAVGSGITSSPGLIDSLINQAQIEDGAEYIFDIDGILIAQYIK